MESLNLNTGAVTLAINGDKSRTITFYPTDIRFVESFFGLCEAFLDKQKELDQKQKEVKDNKTKEIALRRETFDFMRGEIDRVFGTGTAQTVFGDHDVLTAYVQFFRGIEPYVRKARKEELDRYLGNRAAEDKGTVMDL